MTKIAFIATNEFVPWGGSECCWSAAAERLARRGVQVHVSVKDWGVPVKQVEHLRSVGCRIFLRPGPSLGERLRRRILLRNGYPSHHLGLIAAGADLLVISQGGTYDGLDWMEAARSQRFRYAVISQSAADYWWHADDFSERLSACFEHASAAYFVSQANIEVTRRQLVAPLKHARAIQNPFNVRYDAQPPWPNDSSGTLSLACVARLDALQKGQDLLLQVLDRPHWRSRSIRVTFVGTGTNERALRKTAANLKLANVEFAGFVEGIEEFWAHHHALVLPSRFEGMPLALVEAMLCARPCIVTDVAGHHELVRDNINGFLAKAPTVDLLDQSMNCAWESRDRWKQMGEVAARDVREWASPDPTGDLVRELDTLLQANHP